MCRLFSFSFDSVTINYVKNAKQMILTEKLTASCGDSDQQFLTDKYVKADGRHAEIMTGTCAVSPYSGTMYNLHMKPGEIHHKYDILHSFLL
jgi:hypothetical protein